MRSIKARLRHEQKKNPSLADLTNFASAISGQGFKIKEIKKNFYELVDEEDYTHLEAHEMKQLFRWLNPLRK